MKKLIPIALLLGAAGLSACDDNSQQQVQRDQFHQVEVERQEKIAAQSQARENESSRNFWQFVAYVLACGSIVLLVVGVTLGSTAKNHVKRD